MSWNILAAELAHTHAAELYPHASANCLAWPRRLAAVARHVAAQRPDVLCLQEVDDWPGLRGALEPLGYDGVHLQRTGGRGDGCATMWLRDRLRVAGSGNGSRGSGSRGVHRIHMADHDLRDNVALLVYLQPLKKGGGGVDGGGSGGRSGEGPAGRATTAAEGEKQQDSGMELECGGGVEATSSSGGGSGSGDCSSGDDAEGAGGAGGPQQQQHHQSSRRPKRTRQSCEGDVDAVRGGGGDGGGGSAAATAAATSAAAAAIASLRPYPTAGSGGGGRTAAAPEPSARPRTPGRQRGAAPEPAEAAVGGPSTSALPKHLRRGFWVANTHVLFNTKRGDIKLGQLRVILAEVAARAAAAADAGGGNGGGGGEDDTLQRQVSAASAQSAEEASAAAEAALPVIFAGDFNAAPGSGLYRFLRHGELHLAGEDRRELSGQVEGYGYSSLQRDAQAGRPTRLVRWRPPPPTSIPPNLAPSSSGVATGIANGAGPGATDREPYGPPSSTEEWRRQRQGQQQPQAAGGCTEILRRSYSVRWETEELVHAMGQVALSKAMAAVSASKVGQQAGDGTDAAEGNPDLAPGCGRGGGAVRGPQPLALTPRGRGQGQGRGRGGSAAAGPSWPELAEAAMVRNPLELRSAYAAVDPQDREPLFTTLHARYVGTVDFVWYTPGRGGPAGGGGDKDVEGAGGGGGDAGGFRLAPLRVLHPPDPLSYPYGIPCADWPSDHVSLVVDFILR